MRKVVFLDRDGTLIFDIGYLNSCKSIRIIPGTIEALQIFTANGYELVIVSNQSGIARGYFTEDSFIKNHQCILDIFMSYNVYFLDNFYCPHLPKARNKKYDLYCSCRKPHPGMIHKAANTHNIDIGNSIMIGDKISDMEAGLNAGIKENILVNSHIEVNLKNVKKFSSLYDYALKKFLKTGKV